MRLRIWRSMSLGWSPTGTYQKIRKEASHSAPIYTFVNPGKSTKVKSKTSGLQIRRDMGSLLTPLFCPATRNVSCSISFRTSWKSVNLLSTWRNWAHSVQVEGIESAEGSRTGVWTSCRTRGLRVTIPWPRGKKSRPTILQ